MKFVNVLIYLSVIVTIVQGDRRRTRGGNGKRNPVEKFLTKDAKHFSMLNDPSGLDDITELSTYVTDRIENKYGQSTVLHDDPGPAEDDRMVKIADGQPGIPLSMTKYIYEGDIILTPKQAKDKLEYLKRKAAGKSRKSSETRSRGKRKMYRYKGAWWRQFPIQYTYSYDVAHPIRLQIEKALDFWEDQTCITFKRVKRNTTADYVEFFQGTGCYSVVGRAEGKQGVSVGHGCAKLGTLTHEIGHSLGLWHEQSRSDADCCITVQKNNIIKAAIGNFLSQPVSQIITYDIPYDLGSVMHYGPTAFSNAWKATTIKTNLPGYQNTIGQRVLPSFYDVKVINTHYCSEKCLQNYDAAACKRGGYPHPSDCDKCICPEGLGGNNCQHNQLSKNNCGGVIELTNGENESEELHSPGYPTPGFPTSTKCSWLIKSPENTIIQIRFYRDFSFYCSATCIDYVEVKNSTDFGLTGMRFCCNERPSGIFSASNEMVVLFNANYYADRGFKAQVRIRRLKSKVTKREKAEQKNNVQVLFDQTENEATSSEEKKIKKAKKKASKRRSHDQKRTKSKTGDVNDNSSTSSDSSASIPSDKTVNNT